jgi:phage anti-repressor protein
MVESKHTTDLIPLILRTIGTQNVQTVHARDLYDFLGIKQRFNDWITKRIGQYEFLQDIDFIRYCDSSSENPNPPIDYYLSIDMAKELSMVERTKKGKEARLYFLDCERRAEERIPPMTHGDLLVQMAEAYRLQEQRVLVLEKAHQAQQEQRIEDQAALISLLQHAQRAETKADLAIEDLHRMTVQEFILKNGLCRQFHPPSYGGIGKWLTDYSQRYGLRVRKAPVVGKPWDDENSYELQALGAWLDYEQRRPRQITLVKEDTL